jgi:hypothetical protein
MQAHSLIVVLWNHEISLELLALWTQIIANKNVNWGSFRMTRDLRVIRGSMLAGDLGRIRVSSLSGDTALTLEDCPLGTVLEEELEWEIFLCFHEIGSLVLQIDKVVDELRKGEFLGVRNGFENILNDLCRDLAILQVLSVPENQSFDSIVHQRNHLVFFRQHIHLCQQTRRAFHRCINTDGGISVKHSLRDPKSVVIDPIQHSVDRVRIVLWELHRSVLAEPFSLACGMEEGAVFAKHTRVGYEGNLVITNEQGNRRVKRTMIN